MKSNVSTDEVRAIAAKQKSARVSRAAAAMAAAARKAGK